MKELLIAGLVAVWGVSFVFCDNLPLKQCPGLNFEDLADNVNVTPCGKDLCKLYHGSNITVYFRFKPKSKVTSLVHDIYALVPPLELPFIGVTGKDACPDVTRNGAPAPCPLEPDTVYELTDVIPVENYYPTLKMTVKWGLRDQKKDFVACFMIPAVIKEAKKSKH